MFHTWSLQAQEDWCNRQRDYGLFDSKTFPAYEKPKDKTSIPSLKSSTAQQLLRSAGDETGNVVAIAKINLAPRDAILNDLGILHVLQPTHLPNQDQIQRLVSLTLDSQEQITNPDFTECVAPCLEEWPSSAGFIVSNYVEGGDFDELFDALLQMWPSNHQTG